MNYGVVHDIRQGKCDFADYFGDKHKMIWTVGLSNNSQLDKKKVIRKTSIWLLKITVDDEPVVWFEAGNWNKRPPLIGVARDAYKMVMALYS